MPTISEDACRNLLATTELILRTVLFRSGRLCRQLHRKKIHTEELNAILSDMNLSYLLNACSGTNAYVLDEAGMWELDPTEFLIHTEMQSIVEKKVRPTPKVELFCEWLCFHGVSCAPANPAPKPSEAAEPAPLQPALAGKNVYIVREVAPQFLSAEASDFLATLTGIIEEYFQLIDREMLQVSFKKWQYTVSVLRSHSRLQVLLPSLMLYLLQASVRSQGSAASQRFREENASSRRARGAALQRAAQPGGTPQHRRALPPPRRDVPSRLAQRQ